MKINLSVYILLLVPFFSIAQTENLSQFTIELDYNILNTSNEKLLTNTQSTYYNLNVDDQNSLKTKNISIGLRYSFLSKHVVKVGYGNFQNGLLLTGDIASTDQTFEFIDVKTEYQYKKLDLSYIYQQEMFSMFQMNFEAGLSYLKLKNLLRSFYLPIKEKQFQSFFKVGISKSIWKGIKAEVRMCYHRGLSDFKNSEIAQINDGFLPSSFGVEFSVGYTFPKF